MVTYEFQLLLGFFASLNFDILVENVLILITMVVCEDFFLIKITFDQFDYPPLEMTMHLHQCILALMFKKNQNDNLINPIIKIDEKF